MPGNYIDWDGDGLRLFQAFWDNQEDHQVRRDAQCERDYQLFHAFVDMTYRNMNMANVSIPKLYNIINTKSPTEIKAILGRRPYIPIDAVREEFIEQGKLSETLLDFYLEKGKFAPQFFIGDIMAMLYGTAYIEAVPFLDDISEKRLIPQYVDTYYGRQLLGFIPEREIVQRFRFRIRAYAPWEVRVDKLASNLETREGCRGLVKIKICSKREIIRLAEKGRYGKNFDADRLRHKDRSDYRPDRNRGAQILSTMGLPEPDPDGDIGILFEFESPDRYMKVWNDEIPLEDGDNPHDKKYGGHGLINLTRIVHGIDPHTNASFYGNGEGKINEPLSNLYNDMFNMALNNHAMMGQGKTYYAKKLGIKPEQLVHAVGNKIGVDIEPGEDIKKLVYDDYGKALPADHYNLLSLIDRDLDRTSKSNPPSRGESPSGNQTLGEIGLLKEADEAGIELNVRVLEEITMTDFGNKCLAHIEQYARNEDIIEVLGEEKANTLLFTNPSDLPGGFNYGFPGSDKIINQYVRQRNLVNLDKSMNDERFVDLREWRKVLLEAHDLDDVVDKVLKTPEEVAMLQSQALLSQQSGSLNQNNYDLRNIDIARERGEAFR